MTPWLASFTRRWHASPDLCHTVDPVAAHSGRMGILALHLWGEGASRDLLAACLAHDLGESVTGDIPWGAKANPKLREVLDTLEAQALEAMGMPAEMEWDTYRRLKFLDRLDAYLWAKHHAPQVLARDDWKKCLAWLQSETENLNIKGISL